MARILIAWELGEAFGHLSRCLRLAQSLNQHGHRVTLAVKDIRLPGGRDAVHDVAVVPAPMMHQPSPADRGWPVSYADVLRVSGFAQAQDLAARLAAWRDLFAFIRPDLVLGDHAPTALLAATMAGVSHLAIGTGFANPPSTTPWPSIRPWEPIPDAALVAAEQRLDGVTDAAQQALGFETPVRVRELLGDDAVLGTFPELDHYGERPAGRYVGPIVAITQAPRVRWQSREGTRVLAYLRPAVPGYGTILRALGRLDVEVLCVIPGMSLDMARRFATPSLRLALFPIDLPPLLAETDVAVSYGSTGFSCQALLAGVPLLMHPRYIEQMLFARRVETLGAGTLLNDPITVESVTAALQELLEQPSYRRAAQAFYDRYRHFTSEHAIDQAIAFIEQALPG